MCTSLQQLHAAAFQGDANAVRDILEHLEAVYGRNSGINFPLFGIVAIQCAAASGDVETVRILLEHGATDIKAAFWTAVEGDYVDLVRFLLEEYVSLEDVKLNPEQRTLLDAAAEYGSPKLLAFALARDNSKITEDELVSALFHATTYQENIETVRILIEPVQQRVANWREVFEAFADISGVDMNDAAISLLQDILMSS